MDLAREVSFAETREDDGRIVSSGLWFEDAIRDALLKQVSLEAVGCFHRATGFYKRRHCSEILPTTAVFTDGNTKTQATETTHVSKRELCAPLQLPIGDDVSALHPLRSSVDGFRDVREERAHLVSSGKRILAAMMTGSFS